MARYFRRLVQADGLAGVEVPDFRITPYIVVDPFRIERRLPKVADKRGPLFRSDLDFEARTISIAESDQRDVRPRFFHEAINLGMDLRDTAEYRHHMDRIARTGRARMQIRTEEQVLAYLEGKLQIYHTIREAGEIRPVRELFGHRREEIGCMIDHDGKLVKGENGNNRFAIARMLGIRAVPVQIDIIHANQIPVIEQLPGRSPISKINHYLSIVQVRYAPSADVDDNPT